MTTEKFNEVVQLHEDLKETNQVKVRLLSYKRMIESTPKTAPWKSPATIEGVPVTHDIAPLVTAFALELLSEKITNIQKKIEEL